MIITDMPHVSEADYEIYERLSNERLLDNATLLCGYAKSGNTWLRFVVYNYFNILISDAKETITFDQLEKLQPHNLDSRYQKDFMPGFPIFMRTHNAYTPIFDIFKNVIFVYRNPLDTMISNYYYFMNRKEPFRHIPPEEKEKFFDIDYFVRKQIRSWVIHYLYSIDHATHVVDYDKARLNPFDVYKPVLEAIGGGPIDELALEKAISYSGEDGSAGPGRHAPCTPCGAPGRPSSASPATAKRRSSCGRTRRCVPWRWRSRSGR